MTLMEREPCSFCLVCGRLWIPNERHSTKPQWKAAIDQQSISEWIWYCPWLCFLVHLYWNLTLKLCVWINVWLFLPGHMIFTFLLCTHFIRLSCPLSKLSNLSVLRRDRPNLHFCFILTFLFIFCCPLPCILSVIGTVHISSVMNYLNPSGKYLGEKNKMFLYTVYTCVCAHV